MRVEIEPSWQNRLQTEFDKPYFEILVNFVKRQYAQKRCYPAGAKIFNAFNLCPFEQVRVVIIGQDPYHEAGQANGLCFSVNRGVALPPSLVNIYKELSSDLQVPCPIDGDLERWARQGVLLLNSTLTVEEHKAGSHQNKGWEDFTDAVIQIINEQKTNIVFLLWGNYAMRKGQWIDKRKHCVLTAAHPSPLSATRGFFGCKHFSKTNQYLVQHQLTPIEWC